MLIGCRRKSTGYQWLGSPQTFFWEHGDSAELGEPGYPIRRTANSHTSWTIEFGVNPRFFALLGSLFSQQVNFQCHYIRVAAKMIEKCLQEWYMYDFSYFSWFPTCLSFGRCYTYCIILYGIYGSRSKGPRKGF